MNLRPDLDSWVRERHNKLSTDSNWVTLTREQKANRLKDCILADHDLYGKLANDRPFFERVDWLGMIDRLERPTN